MIEMPVSEKGSINLRRRRGDVLKSPSVLDLVDFLLARPNCDQIAQHLVLRLLSHHHLRAAVISVFTPDASLNEIGAFGMSEPSLDGFWRLSLDERTPLTDAVRTGEPVILLTAEEVEERYPLLCTGGCRPDPLAVWPLVLPDEYVGSIEFTFTATPDVETLRSDATGIAAVLALYLSLLREVPNSAPPSTVPGAAEVDPAATGVPELRLVRAEPAPLTRRQLQILLLMERGLTNAQISSVIGFSESTVGQDSLEIYRHFDVHGRRAAVERARARGLIGKPSG